MQQTDTFVARASRRMRSLMTGRSVIARPAGGRFHAALTTVENELRIPMQKPTRRHWIAAVSVIAIGALGVLAYNANRAPSGPAAPAAPAQPLSHRPEGPPAFRPRLK